MMDGRVKTLHPKVHGGLLAIRDNAEHAARDGRRTASRPIDLLVVNLYPFEATVAKGADFDDLHREHRHRRPGDDPRRRQEPCRRRGRRRPAGLCGGAGASWRRTAARPRWRCASSSPPRPMRAPPPTTRRSPTGSPQQLGEPAPACRAFGGRLAEALRYGENPHQAAAFYRTPASRAPASRPRGRCRARSSPTTTSTTPTRPTNCVAEFDPQAHRRLRHHQARQSVRRRRGRDAARRLPQGARLRSGLGLRRHRRAQPHARRRRPRARSPRSSPR